jgi:pimeloyl-ACP methyl ester carboxylesterase
VGDVGPRPLILIRGFGGTDLAGEQSSAYQGFNDGTVYPGRRGDNFIYEGFLLRCLKSDRYRYTDATNVVGYYAEEVDPPANPDGYDVGDVSGTVVIDPETARRVLAKGTVGTIWVYRYYDLAPRALETYGDGLVNLIKLIRTAAGKYNEAFRGVDVVAHSMGGLVLREALRALKSPEKNADGPPADQLIHRIVTLGTPHRGIAFQRLPGWLLQHLPGIEKASNELAAFDPTSTEFLEVAEWYPIRRILTVVGTNYRTYGTSAASLANRLSSLFDEGSLVSNRSDGLVKQASAQLPNAPRTFVHKCHGGQDSLVTSREAYEIAMRFFHGTHVVRLWLDSADIKRGGDVFGRSEFYFGVSVKPRYVDFELFHQSPEAENCYGPFNQTDLLDSPPDLAAELRKKLADFGDKTTGWAGPDRLIWEGWIDAGATPDTGAQGLVFRLDVYVGERDSRGIGFSDNVIFRKQYYVQAFPGDPLALFVHTGEEYLSSKTPASREQLDARAKPELDAAVQLPTPTKSGGSGGTGEWTFRIGGTGFAATLRVAIELDQ